MTTIMPSKKYLKNIQYYKQMHKNGYSCFNGYQYIAHAPFPLQFDDKITNYKGK